MRQRNMYLMRSWMQKENRHGAVVKWVDYGSAGRSQEWDLLTHLMSTSSGAACWMWPHPLPHNPTRDDLAPTWAMLLDLTRTQLSATQGLNITLMWLRSMTERIMWQSYLCTFVKKGSMIAVDSVHALKNCVKWKTCRSFCFLLKKVKQLTQL